MRTSAENGATEKLSMRGEFVIALWYRCTRHSRQKRKKRIASCVFSSHLATSPQRGAKNANILVSPIIVSLIFSIEPLTKRKETSHYLCIQLPRNLRHSELSSSVRGVRHPFVLEHLHGFTILKATNGLCFAVAVLAPECPGCIMPCATKNGTWMEYSHASNSADDHQAFEDHEWNLLVGKFAIKSTLKLGNAEGGTNEDENGSGEKS